MICNILIVEDTRDWRTKLAGYLDKGKYNIHEADNYEDAIKLLRTETFEVVLIDIRLEDWDEENEHGMQLLRDIEDITKTKGTQSIIITGYATPDRMREAFRDFQVTDFIQKQGFDPEEYRETVRHAAKTALRKRGEIMKEIYLSNDL